MLTTFSVIVRSLAAADAQDWGYHVVVLHPRPMLCFGMSET
jgi:hypothetical protein